MWRSLVYFTLFVVAQVFAAALALAYVGTCGGTADTATLMTEENAVPVGVSLLVAEGMLSLALGWWMLAGRKLRRLSFLSCAAREIERKSSTSTDVLRAVMGVLLLSVAVSQVSDIFSLPDGGTAELFEGMRRSPLCLLLICFVGPLTEELVFRAGIVRCLSLRGLQGWVAAMVSAAAFGAVHGNLAQALPAFVIGVVLGLLYLRTGDLRMCLPAHVANNVLGVALICFPSLESVEGSWTLAAVSLAAGAYLLYGALSSEKKEKKD